MPFFSLFIRSTIENKYFCKAAPSETENNGRKSRENYKENA